MVQLSVGILENLRSFYRNRYLVLAMLLVQLCHLLLKIGLLVFEVYKDWHLSDKFVQFGIGVLCRD